MSNKMSINVSGGAFTVGQFVQGENVATHGEVQVQVPPEAIETFRAGILAQATNRGLDADERRALDERVAALEGALAEAAKTESPSALQRVGKIVEDFTGAFGWAAPILKPLLAVCAPPLAALL
jgi:hypothetical protein